MENSINFAFPLKGFLLHVAQGGNSVLINHHYKISAQKFGVDLVQLNQYGERSKTLFPKSLDDFFIYAALVYSPCEGKVIQLKDGLENQQIGWMDRDHPAGNYVAIHKKDSHAVVILAHLLKGSLLIQEGDTVSTGQPLAKVGNSGNTSEPHLHIHCVSDNAEDFLFKGEGIPMIFNRDFLSRNDLILQARLSIL